MKKTETLEAWRTMQDNQPMLKHFEPVPYKATGSRYGACGIRIDGTPAFVDAVLSHLKELIAGENHCTRLELARHVVDGSGIEKSLPNASTGAECCYIRLHVRGGEGARASAIFDRQLDGATKTYLQASNQ